MPARYNFPTIVRGDTKTLAMRLLRRDILSEELQPFSFVGADVEWTISPPGRQPIVKTGASGLSIDPTTGEVSNQLSSTDTENMPSGSIPYRVRYVVDSSEKTTVLVGIVPFED